MVKGYKRPGIGTSLWHLLGLGGWILLLRILNRVSVFGTEHIPKRGERGILLLYNHTSAIDPFVVGVTSMPFFSPVWWRAPAKEDLFRYPIVRNILASWGAFPVRRGKHDFEAMVNMAEMLKEGVIVIAPEGRRSRDGRLLPGRPGVGKIIHDALPQKVIPVALQGTERVLPPGRILPRLFQKVRICYGAPMDLSPYYGLPHSREVSQRIVDEVMARIAEMKREL